MQDAQRNTPPLSHMVQGTSTIRAYPNGWAQRMVSLGLVGTVLISVVAIAVLAVEDRQIPPALGAIGSAALGALASALAPLRHE